MFTDSETVALLGVPGSFFTTPDMLEAPDGAHLAPWWEIRIGDRAPGSTLLGPVYATAIIPDWAIPDGSISGSLQAYFFDPSLNAWTVIPTSQVDLGSRIATFPVAAPGIYALGGFHAVVVPGFDSLATGVFALVLVGVAAFWFSRRRPLGIAGGLSP